MRFRLIQTPGMGRFRPAVALTAAAALLIAGVLMGVYNERSYVAQNTSEAEVQARILASSVIAALAFDDRKAAQEYVNALAANPKIRGAAVYDAEGERLASYSRPDDPPPPATRPEKQGSVNGDIAIVMPVAQGGSTLGSVYLRTATERLEQRLSRYVGMALLVTMASLLVGALGTAHAALTKANSELAERAADLTSTNAALHAQIEVRERAEDALRQAQKMETIGQLTGGVAHDFNNLLTIVIGNLERLRRRLASRDTAELERIADGALQGAQRAAGLTRSLLAFSRRQPLNPKPVEVNKLVSHMSELLRRSLGEQVTIETVLAGGLWRTLADPNQLENAVLNLAVNARDAMPGGGKLTIETANAYLDAGYVADQEDLARGQYVALSISDTGAGMSEDVIKKAFEPFFTTKDIGHGTGLGLSQVYGFVKQSGGHVKIYSELGQGTTVKIYLPRLIAAEHAVEAPPQPQLVHAGDGSQQVLVVEDEDGVREHSLAMLTELGYRVLEAANGAAALKILDQEPGIDLLFTDVGLPGGMNGRQLADEACRRRPGLKVLFTTGYARNAIVHEGRLDPGVHLVTKPFTASELAAAVHEVLDRRTEPARVLIVEDEMLIRMNAADALQKLGFSVSEAGTAAEALQVVQSAARGIAAVLIDLGLPDRRGDSLAAEIRSMHDRLPIIIASGFAEPGVRERFAADRMLRFLDKPYDDHALTAVLGALGITAGKSPGNLPGSAADNRASS